MPVLEFRSVSKSYATTLHASSAYALRDVSFSVESGETLGLVGESGSGKSTIARIAVGLLTVTSGVAALDGQVIGQLRGRRLRQAREAVGFVFQDPYASLNPRHRIGSILSLPFRVHTGKSDREIRHDVAALLDRVGLRPVERYVGRFPHQLSGGQRQRVAIARAIALRPALLIADEPVASLDVSIAGQILNLLREVQAELGSSSLFISHDLGVVRAMTDRTIVLNRGCIVESGPTSAVLARPAHPYTQLLLASTPELMRLDHVEASEPGRPFLPDGCPFYPRCPYAMSRCVEMPPDLKVSVDHVARCWLLDEREPPASWRQAMAAGAESEVSDER